MNTISWFKNYLLEIQNEAIGVKRNRLVLDDSELSKYLSEHSEADNHLLVGVMPSFTSTGTDVDNHQLKGYTQLLILQKTSYSSVNYDEYLNIFEEAFEVAKAVVTKLKQDAWNGKCKELSLLKTSSIQIVPIWNKSSCNGWNVMFNFDEFK